MSDDKDQMSELVRQRKRLAMGVNLDGTSYTPRGKASGGKADKKHHYAKGGSVKSDTIDGSGTGLPAELTHQKNVNKIGPHPEKGVDRLPAKGVTPKITKPVPNAIATMKRGGHAQVMRKNAGRGR
jgi:hypothetical protein